MAWCRGLYRSSAEKWFTPDDVAPPGSDAASDGKGMRSRLANAKSGRREMQFKIPSKLAPVYLAFNLVSQDAGTPQVKTGPASGSPHFAVPIGLHGGNPLKYGQHLLARFFPLGPVLWLKVLCMRGRESNMLQCVVCMNCLLNSNGGCKAPEQAVLLKY